VSRAAGREPAGCACGDGCTCDTAVWPAHRHDLTLLAAPPARAPAAVQAGDGLVTVSLPVQGLCCADEANQIRALLGRLPGVRDIQPSVAASRVTVLYDPAGVGVEPIAAALAAGGFAPAAGRAPASEAPALGRALGWGALGCVAVVVLVAAVGERLGLLDEAVARLPWWVPALAIAAGGWPVLRGVLQAARLGRVTGHTLMTVGAVAAAAAEQWTTAALLVFFMRFSDWVEALATERSRRALRELVALQPATARVLRAGREEEVPVDAVAVGDLVVVRPGERIPVDGEVVEGEAPVDQAPITGESLPVDKTPGDAVFAATVAQAGFLKVRATRVGADTTFGRIVRLVEDAEAHKAPVQRFADRFAGYYLPAVVVAATATYLATGLVLNAVAVLVVSCACSIAMATPVTVLASVGNGARRGLLVKGGAALEQLARVDTVVMDKTGTLTRGQPRLTDVVTLNGLGEAELLRAIAGAECRSEHPLARAIVRASAERGLAPPEPATFQALPGRGVAATVEGRAWLVGNRRLLAERGVPVDAAAEARARDLEVGGKTVFFAADGAVAGLVAVADVLRPEAREAVAELRRLGVRRLLLLTGDDDRVAAAVAGELGVEHRANLLPEDKIAAVRDLQATGAVVMMVGDGVNDAPALAQADVGVAMGAAGTDAAIEAADVALMRDDWTLVPEAIRVGRRAARTIRQNLAFTALYNTVGIALAATGVLPPVWAAAAQSLPDVAVMANAARLLRAGRSGAAHPIR
jgi:Cd2+/Zn2+-exporting ATPase/Cu+-exporting ATPase